MEAVLISLVPIALIATTRNVYEVPLFRPVKDQLVALIFVQPTGEATAGVDVTE